MSRPTVTHTHTHTDTDTKKRVEQTWDVERLWALVSDLPTKSVPIESISALDERIWPGINSGRYPTCRQVADSVKRVYEVDFAYPIILSAEGWIMDGMHRLCKAYILGMECIDAVQFTQNPTPDKIIESEV